MATPILMPALSPTMKEGSIAKWLKNEGDSIEPGQIIAEIETDKAIMELESIDYGTIGKILVQSGTPNVKVNQLIAVLLEQGEDAANIEKVISADSTVSLTSNTIEPEKAETINEIVNETNNIIQVNSSEPNRIYASPLAKKIAIQNDLDISLIQPGSGPHGRIIKNDVISFIEKNNNKSSSILQSSAFDRNLDEFTTKPLTNIRKIIASRLVESKQTIPHFYLSIDCNIDELIGLRTNINNNISEKEGKPAFKISINDFVVKAVGLTLKIIPEVNSSWSENAIIEYNNVDISIAVAIDNGLVTPIIKNVDLKSISHISNEIKIMVERARANKLKLEEYQGGGFSISNLGMYGIQSFYAIVNPPQSCIMSVGAAIQKPVVIDGQIKIANIMNVTLSCDHRVIDGKKAAEFLATFKKYIESPILMLV